MVLGRAVLLNFFVSTLLMGAAPVVGQNTRNGDRANWPARVNPLPFASSRVADSVPVYATPSMGASSPTAFGLSFGDVFVAASFQSRVRYAAEPDGALAAGFGLGDPASFLGLEIDVNSFSTLPSRGSPAGLGGIVGVDVKLHRLLPLAFGVAAGWESLLSTSHDGVGTDGGSNGYVVFSKWFSLGDGESFRDLVVSAGAGSGRFLRERRWTENADQIGPFGSVALRVARPASLIADWTGQDLLLGASLAPLAHYPLVLNAGVVDVLGTTDGTGRTRLVASASYVFRY
jgi:hypothetical protein